MSLTIDWFFYRSKIIDLYFYGLKTIEFRFREVNNMNDKEKQRVDRCAKCSKSTVLGLFGRKEFYCTLHKRPCKEMAQCVYATDNKKYK